MDNGLASVGRDLRYSIRALLSTPSFVAVAVLTLAIGLGATGAIFSTVDAALLRPLPYPRPGELLDVHTRIVDGRVTTGLLSSAEIAALGDLHDLVAGAAGYAGQASDATLVRPDGSVMPTLAVGVTDGFFGVMGLPMTLGRAFTREEHAAVARNQNPPVSVVMSYHVWTDIYGRDPAIIGKAVRIVEAGAAVRVVGVANRDLDLPHGTDFWLNDRYQTTDPFHNFNTVVRLRPGVDPAALRGAAAVALTNLARSQPSDVGRQYVIRPLQSAIVGDLSSTLLIVLGATVLLLLLACVNVSNLLLARGSARTREVALRAALGASRGRLLRLLMSDPILLVAAGAVAGAAIARVALRLLFVLGASTLPRLDAIAVDYRVLLFGLATLVVSGVLAGLAPAWRLASVDIRGLLNDTGRSTTPSRATSAWLSAMVVVEIALGIALVAGAGWLVQSFDRLRSVDLGFPTSDRLIVDVRPAHRIDEIPAARAWTTELLNRVRAASGDALVGAATTFPLNVDRDGTLNIELQSDVHDPTRVTGGRIRLVTAGFFEAAGFRLAAGRTFTQDDRTGTQHVTIVNRAFVRRFLANVDPLSESLAFGYPEVDRSNMSRIVGVVDDVRYASPAVAAEPTYYILQSQFFPVTRLSVVVKPRHGDGQQLIPAIRRELNAFDPLLVVGFTTPADLLRSTTVRQRLGMTLMLLFGATALVLAAVGIYGVVAYAGEQRRDEITTRIALGASPRNVFWLMMSAGQRLAIGGLAAGLPLAYAGGRIVAASVFEMRAADPVVLVGAAAVVAGVAFAATMIPAVRASRLDPVRTLRAG